MIRVSAVKLPSIVKKPSVPIAHVRAANPKNDPQDGTYHMATHEMTVIDPLHVAAMDPDDALTVEKHPESNAVPFSTESKKIKSSHKENHDPELLEIAMREFGKGYNDLDAHEKHVVGGKKGSAHKASKNAKVEVKTAKSTELDD